MTEIPASERELKIVEEAKAEGIREGLRRAWKLTDAAQATAYIDGQIEAERALGHLADLILAAKELG